MITMAPSLLMAASPLRAFEFFGSTQSFDSTDPQQATIPSETREGDLLLLFVAADSNMTVPSGWTTLSIGNNGSLRWMIAYKVAGASDAGSTFTYLTNNNTDSSAVIAVFGSAATSVFGSDDTNGGTGVVAPSITTLNADDIVIAWGITASAEWAMTLATAGFTTISAVAPASGFLASVGVHYKVQAAAGATGSVTFASGGGDRAEGGLMSITSTL
jgi:hypothetical protein